MDSSHISGVLQQTLVPLVVRYFPVFVTLFLAWITVNELYFKKQSDNKKGEQENNAPPQKAERKPVVPSAIKPPKKKQSTEKWNREGKQNFSHEWLLTSLKGHSGAIMDMDFSANGKFLATCADDRAIFVWSTKHWKEKDHKYIRYNVDYDHASLIRWSPDSKAFIYNRYSDNLIEVCKLVRKPDGWISSLAKALTYPKVHTDEIIGLGIDQNGKYIMTCSSGTDMIVWDLKGTELAKVETYLMNNYAAKISPCGTFVAVSGFAPDVKVWEIQFNKTGEFKQVCRAFELTGHTSGVFDFAFNADSSQIATLSKDKTWKLYNIKIQYTRGEDPHLLKSGKFNSEGKKARIALSPDGQVICLSCDSKLTIINALSGEVDKVIRNVYPDRAIFVWSTKHWKEKDHKYIRYNVDYDHASLIRWSPDSKAFIYNRYSDNLIEVCKLVRKPDGWISSLAKALTYPKVHTDEIIGLGIDQNGKYIMTCSSGTDMIVWDLKGTELAKVETYLMNNYAAKISPCGTFVAVSGFAPDVKVWEIQFNKIGEFKQVCRAFELTGHTSGVFDFAFNADSSQIATLSKDKTWKLYNIKIQYTRGEDPHLLKSGKFNSEGKKARIALSPDGQVICLSCDSTLTIINALSGEVDKVIRNVYPGPISSVAFDAAGEYILTAGDKHVRIFHNVTGYKASILAAKTKLQASGNSSATKERLQITIQEAEIFLKSIGEV